MQIDTTYISTLTDMGDFLQYLVSLYGKELYKDKQHLCNLIADLYKGEERQKKLFRRTILEDNLARRIYDLSQKSLSERKALADAIAYRFAENNYLPKEIGEKVISAFIKGIKLLGEISWKLRKDGNWEDNQGCIYNNDKTILLRGNESLSEIDVVDGTIKISKWAFAHCTALKEINIPNSVTEIGEWAFSSCTALEEINIPNSVTKIGEYAFSSCTALEEINIPSSVTKIEKSVFVRCTALKEINIPNSVTKIGEYAFSNCKALEEINIPSSVTKIEKGVFIRCTALNKIKVSLNNKYYIAKENVLYTKDWKTLICCTNKIHFNIPDNVINIESYAFFGCTALKEINIPNSVTEIGSYTFSDCTALEEINIPNSVTKIGKDAFSYCTELKEINMKNSVKEIGKCACS